MNSAAITWLGASIIGFVIWAIIVSASIIYYART